MQFFTVSGRRRATFSGELGSNLLHFAFLNDCRFNFMPWSFCLGFVCEFGGERMERL